MKSKLFNVKKIVSTIMAVCVVSSLFVGSASASSQISVVRESCGLDYFSSEGRINAYGTARAGCNNQLIKEFRFIIQIRNKATGRIVASSTSYDFDVYGENYTSVSARVGNSNFSCDYLAQLTMTDGNTYRDDYTRSSPTSRSYTPDTSAQLKSERDNMMTDLGYDVNGFTYYYDRDLINAVSKDDYIDFILQLNLSEGDAVPGFYVSEDGKTIVAVKDDSEGNIFEYIFNQTDNGQWELA